MPSFAMPAIDQNICANWPEQDVDTYERLPYFLDKAEASKRKKWETWEPLLTDTINWKANEGDTMRLIVTEDAPVLRQSARPVGMRVEAKGDIFTVRERATEASLVHHKFFSLKYRFLSAFQDFMKGQLMPTRKNIEMGITHFKEMYYRTYMWDWSPVVFVMGRGPVDAPVGYNDDGTPKKDAAWLKSIFEHAQKPGYLSYDNVIDAAGCALEERGMEPYEGDSAPSDNGGALSEKLCLITDREGYLSFANDPWVKENKNDQLDIVNSKFKPTPIGMILARMEKYPLRWNYNADNATPTENAPETIVESGPEKGRTITDPAYGLIANSPYACAWMLGKSGGYRRINVGPPPEFFAGSTSDPAKIAGMDWNGRVYATKNFPIKCVDGNGVEQLDLNSFGEYMRWQAALALGIVGVNTQNTMPLIYLRRRLRLTTSGLPGV